MSSPECMSSLFRISSSSRFSIVASNIATSQLIGCRSCRRRFSGCRRESKRSIKRCIAPPSTLNLPFLSPTISLYLLPPSLSFLYCLSFRFSFLLLSLSLYFLTNSRSPAVITTLLLLALFETPTHLFLNLCRFSFSIHPRSHPALFSLSLSPSLSI